MPVIVNGVNMRHDEQVTTSKTTPRTRYHHGDLRNAMMESAVELARTGGPDAVVLREVEGLSYEEISQVLEVSLGTVKSRILRGRESLRRHLMDRLHAAPRVELPLALGSNVMTNVVTHAVRHVVIHGSDAV